MTDDRTSDQMDDETMVDSQDLFGKPKEVPPADNSNSCDKEGCEIPDETGSSQEESGGRDGQVDECSVLINGLLIAAERIPGWDDHLRSSRDEDHLAVLATELTTGSLHEIAFYVITEKINLSQFEDYHSATLVNGTSRHICLDCHYKLYRTLYLRPTDELIISSGLSLLRLQFHSTLTATDDEDS